MGPKKGRRGGGSPREERRAPSLSRVFEGIDVLDRLLAEAGAEVDGAGAVSRLSAAMAENQAASEVIPGFFPKEPRFPSPGDAMRLYGNLFGLWDLLRIGTDPRRLSRMTAPQAPREEEALEAAEPVAIPLPPRGSLPGNLLPFEVVEGTWQRLADFSPRERTRRQDRYANGQPELAEWARTVEGLSGVGQETLEYLCFELAEMFDHAFAERFMAVRFGQLEGALPEEAERLQPYAMDYLLETLDEAEDEEEPLPDEDRAMIEKWGRKAIVAMTGAVREEE